MLRLKGKKVEQSYEEGKAGNTNQEKKKKIMLEPQKKLRCLLTELFSKRRGS